MRDSSGKKQTAPSRHRCRASTPLALEQLEERSLLSLFGGPSGVAVGSFHKQIATADFNRDGRPDILVLNDRDGTLNVLINDGRGGFNTSAPITLDQGTFQTFAVGDFDRDGKQDIAFAAVFTPSIGSPTAKVGVLLGDGFGRFTLRPQMQTVADSPSSMVAADFDSVSGPDVAVTTLSNDSVSILLNPGNGAFNAPIVRDAGSVPFAVATGDFNGDGVPDLVAANIATSELTRFQNDGTGTFPVSGVSTITLPGNPSRVAAIVFPGGGANGIAATLVNSAQVAVVLPNSPNTATALPGSPYTVGASPTGISVADINQDGQPDLVITANADDAVSVLMGMGPQQGFISAGNFPLGANNGPQAIAAADYDGDGRLDLAVANENTNDINILRNTSGTSVALSSSQNPIVQGQSVTLTANVQAAVPGLGTPTGNIVFLDGTTFLGQANLVNGTASLAKSLSAGAHSLTAVYNPGTDFSGAVSVPLTQTVSRAQTLTNLTIAPSSTVFGQSLTLKAEIVPQSPGSGTPGGSVTFAVDGVVQGIATVGSDRTASFTASTLSAGPHTLQAFYSGDDNFAASASSAVNRTVQQAQTATSLSTSSGSVSFGQAVTFTATVTTQSPGVGTPDGLVTFLDGATTLGTSVLSGGRALFTIATLAPGQRQISATYQGSTSFQGSTASAIAQTISPVATVTSLVTSLNPAAFGQALTLQVTVSATSPAAGLPDGSVELRDGTTSLGTSMLQAGRAQFVITALAPGQHNLTAVYAGTGSFQGSSSSPLTQSVNQASAMITLTSSGSASISGHQVTLTATVTPTSQLAGTPKGKVTFSAGGQTLGSADLVNQKATIQTSSLAVGNNSVVAVYEGNAGFSPVTSGPFIQNVLDQNGAFVSTVYQDLLRRPVDPAGLTTWLNFLAQPGATRITMVRLIETSTEYLNLLVQDLYQRYLHRPADQSGLSTFIGALSAGGSIQQVSATLISSSEYFLNRSGGTLDGFLDSLYHDALKRDIDPQARKTFTEFLTSGGTRRQVADTILNSAEYAGVEVQAIYQTFLRRAADSDGLTMFVKALMAGVPEQDILATVVGSAEYLNRI